MIYTDCLRLVEKIDFDIKIVPIRVRMQKLEPSEYSPDRRQKTGAPHQTPCLMGSARDSLFRATDLTLKMTSDQKTFNIKVVRLVETVKIAFGLVSIRDRLPP